MRRGGILPARRLCDTASVHGPDKSGPYIWREMRRLSRRGGGNSKNHSQRAAFSTLGAVFRTASTPGRCEHRPLHTVRHCLRPITNAQRRETAKERETPSRARRNGLIPESITIVAAHSVRHCRHKMREGMCFLEIEICRDCRGEQRSPVGVCHTRRFPERRFSSEGKIDSSSERFYKY